MPLKDLGSMRTRVQILSLMIINSYFLPFFKHIPFPVLNCYSCPLATNACPIGTLQHFLVIGKIPFFTIGVMGSIGSLFGRMTCGWVCPFGFLQDLVHKIPIPVKKRKIPEKYGFIKFISLILVILGPLILFEPLFCMICPVGTFEAGIPSVLIYGLEIGSFFYFKLAILVSIFFLMMVFSRPFCKIFCPLGAILALFNAFSRLRLKVDEGCIECGKCEKVCPMDIKVYEKPNSINCIRCLKCTEVCDHISLVKT